ncbi:MAG: type II secretion system F family protein [Bdellovibrionota bacterium]
MDTMVGANVDQLAMSYRNFKTLLDSGHDLRGALGLLRESGSGVAKSQATHLLSFVEQGRKLSDGMRVLSYPDMDVALVSVGETTGFLPDVAGMLSTYYDERSQMLKAVKAALPQPLMLFCISVVTSPLPAYFTGKLSGWGFIATTVGPISLVIALIVAGFELYRRMLFDRKVRRYVLDRLEKVKGLRNFVRTFAMERFLTCAALALKSGCDFFEMVRMLAVVSEGTYLQPVPAIFKSVGPNEGVAKAMERSKVFSHEQVGSAKIGEASGTLASQFEAMAKAARERVHMQITLFSVWVPKILYGLMLAYVAYSIVSNAMSSPIVTGDYGVEE